MKYRVFVFFCLALGAVSSQECDWQNPKNDGCQLHPMTVEFDGYNETFRAYMSPDVSTFYQEAPGTRKVKKPQFNGLFGKFINLSANRVQVHWDAGPKRDPVYISDIQPFDASGTATYPGHKFFLNLPNDKNNHLAEFSVKEDNCLYVYEDSDLDPSKLSEADLEKYMVQRDNVIFAKQYREATGRDWLTLYGRRGPPTYPMWEANYFGQTHSVSTFETHFVDLPPEKELAQQSSYSARTLREYRSPEGTLNLTLKVISCEPRAFEIHGFLSDVEIDHILELATGIKLHRSETRSSSDSKSLADSSTRTSYNSWIARGKSPIIDTLYRRAADLLRIDEALLRLRTADEYPEMGTRKSIAERLQLVHYNISQQYTPHHDAAIPWITKDQQPSRFATVLFYLNEGMEGGETSFPKWTSAESSAQLKVKPERGKAVLFYSLLPDGNIDDKSMHAALPVTKGEKWLINLWTWDPYYE